MGEQTACLYCHASSFVILESAVDVTNPKFFTTDYWHVVVQVFYVRGISFFIGCDVSSFLGDWLFVSFASLWSEAKPLLGVLSGTLFLLSIRCSHLFD